MIGGNYLPPVEKTIEEIQLDFFGPIRFKHRRFYIFISKDRYSRWQAACIWKMPTGKRQKISGNNTSRYTACRKQLQQTKARPFLKESLEIFVNL